MRSSSPRSLRRSLATGLTPQPRPGAAKHRSCGGQDVRAGPQRLLDADVGNALRPAPRRARSASCRARHAAPARGLAEDEADRRAARRRSRSCPPGSSSPSPPRRSPRLRDPQAERRPRCRSASNARTATPVSTTATVSASSSSVAAREAARAQALEHRRLRRAAGARRGRSRSGGRRPGRPTRSARGGGSATRSPVDAVGEVPQALLQLARAAARAAPRRSRSAAPARELLAQRGLDPAAPRAGPPQPSRSLPHRRAPARACGTSAPGVAHAARSAPRSSSSPSALLGEHAARIGEEGRRPDPDAVEQR